ncbi:PS_pyruv_trans domain-containing protein [Thauera humireducens]|uniref:polysaccharide pyruvyl transferase family protein n=1 Tax=Thauera humireducens TaxID=1134435 RepID=UPI002467AC07|nr:polysaccharide pyruvyl transferase family protein [Thauera humireducens]CAH1746853.1 PS_pyruv_trans domain-containing protein [Thauera humireducens]
MLKVLRNLSAAVAGDLVIRYSRSEETRSNWGDALNAYLIPKLSGRRIVHFRSAANLGYPRVYSAIGSVLDNSSTRNLHVWGSGFKSASSKMKAFPARVYAVRGPRTREKLESFGVRVPAVYGDPALLVDRFVPPSPKKHYRLGLIPHYVDRDAPALQGLASEEVLVIDVNAGIEEFVRQVTSCEVIASSSLHGLIAADCYRIPSVWLRISNKVIGGEFKFSDYFAGVGITKRAFALDESARVDTLCALAEYQELSFDADLLLDACPFLSAGFPR